MSVTLVGGISNDPPQEPLLNYWNLNGYVFDAWLRLGHNSSNVITQHPVQTGANITDHSFEQPKRFSFEIGISDVVRAIPVPNGRAINAQPTRVQNAYDVLDKMRRERKLLYLVSKYGYFEGILIESIDIPDDYTTQSVIKATVNLTQVIIVDTQTEKVSGLPQLTDQTNRGSLQGQQPQESILYQQYGVTIPGSSQQ